MNRSYSNKLKKKLCIDVCVYGKSTIKTAEENGVPLKTFEKWITAYNKDPHYFDFDDSSNNSDFKLINPPSPIDSYSDLSMDELKLQLMKKDIEIQRLKKGYTVKGGGMDQKVFISFSTKNTK